MENEEWKKEKQLPLQASNPELCLRFPVLRSPFSILHFFILSFVSWCLRGQKSGLGINGFAEVLRDLSQSLIKQFGSVRLQIQSQQRLRA